MMAAEHFHTDNEAHKLQVREKLQKRTERQQKLMTGFFWAGVVLSGLVTLALFWTFLASGVTPH